MQDFFDKFPPAAAKINSLITAVNQKLKTEVNVYFKPAIFTFFISCNKANYVQTPLFLKKRRQAVLIFGGGLQALILRQEL